MGGRACQGTRRREIPQVQKSTLPTGYTQALVQAVEGRERGVAPNTLVICGAVVIPSLRGRGFAGEVLMALRRTAEAAGLSRVIVPVRPTAKALYPLTPIENFMTWRRDDGTAFDPWVRTHERLGAKILAAAPKSQTMTGTVSEWESWTRMPLPESGDYVIRGGLSVLRIDRSADQGVYHEPNIWMRHV
ncbi:GNAT family N-acetyltransferase [Nocardia sp. NPDC057663]|uniref:GNAT family N-acetyltransferase n=1 Tax=Nocardia sp. NPDC057663 TaxID=3346201 RepID=UPI00366DE65A